MTRALLLWLVAALLSFEAGQGGQGPEPSRKVVLLAGPMDEHPLGNHEYERTVLFLKHCLEISSNLRGIQADTYFEDLPPSPQALQSADTIVITSAGADRGSDFHPLYSRGRFPRIETAMERGAGLVLLHNSTVNPRSHHDRITEWLGGYFDFESGEGRSPYFSRVENRFWSLLPASPSHPILRGVGPIHIREEVYSRMRFPAEDSRRTSLLLKQAEGDRVENTIAWAVERRGGRRGFGFTPGHYYEHWWNPDFRKLVLNAIVWSAGVEVPAGGVECPPDGLLHLLLLTGHDHPAHDGRAVGEALVHVLRMDPRVQVRVSEDPEEMANLQGYEGVILNHGDRPRLPEAALQGLHRHLSAGGGLSVIHLASGPFSRKRPAGEPDWEVFQGGILRRFWREGESGKEPYGSFPVEIQDREHPITAGLADFEAADELFYRQAGRESIRVLAVAPSQRTGKKEPVAWAYEYGKGRVFQTVLGHSADSIRRAAALIRRGVVWAAGGSPLGFDPPGVLAAKKGLRREPAEP